MEIAGPNRYLLADKHSKQPNQPQTDTFLFFESPFDPLNEKSNAKSLNKVVEKLN